MSQKQNLEETHQVPKKPLINFVLKAYVMFSSQVVKETRRQQGQEE